ncbi:hypothetical protein GCM10027404_13110 [Arthrobacter tumbae]
MVVPIRLAKITRPLEFSGFVASGSTVDDDDDMVACFLEDGHRGNRKPGYLVPVNLITVTEA